MTTDSHVVIDTNIMNGAIQVLGPYVAQLGNSKIKWNFKKNKKLKVELNTVCQWLVVCLKFM